MRRVDQILREAIAEECAELKDPRIGFLTITDVETAPDLRNATVYYSVIGDDEVQKGTAAALASAASRIRTAVGHSVRMKYTPRLQFAIDPSIEQGILIDGLLAEIHEEHDERPTDSD